MDRSWFLFPYLSGIRILSLKHFNHSAQLRQVGFSFACMVAVIGLACDNSVESPPPTNPAEADPRGSRQRTPATYVGRNTCRECHATEVSRFTGSDHDLAMQTPVPAHVRGAFAFESTAPTTSPMGSEFSKDGERFEFIRREDQFFVRVLRPDAESAEYPVRYVFGHDPLEQYLFDVGDGRLQSLSVGWDTRSADAGGQRWFSLYPEESVPPGDELHWLGPNQNWNFMCADCHSTGLRKNYRSEEDRFETQYSEIDVSCESCHGAGSRHVEWARAGGDPKGDRGLDVNLQSDDTTWIFAEGSTTAHRSQPLAHDEQVETCARCHSRRLTIHESSARGQPVADTHRVALLDAGLYHADGQIQDEVFVYGSWIQSKMHAAGVLCTDCHDPHTTQVYSTGNALCLRCHQPSEFDRPEHHHHPMGSEGAQCVNCHMPEKTYMVVDPRRDHSMRVPRPDLSERLGTPNACNGCHGDQSNAWAAAAVEEWYDGNTSKRPQFADAIHAGRQRSRESTALLVGLINDPNAPAIARATAVTLLPQPFPNDSIAAVERASQDSSPLVRRAVADNLIGLGLQSGLSTGQTLLSDPTRTVRIATATSLAGAEEALDPSTRKRLAEAIEETRRSLELHLDRVEACYNLGNLELAVGNHERADALFDRALTLNPLFTPARLNRADVFRIQGRDSEAAALLEVGLELSANHPELLHSLGLARVRLKDPSGATSCFQRAAALRPDNPRYSLLHALAVRETGDLGQALVILRAAVKRHPNDPDLVGALVAYLRENGDASEAEKWSERGQARPQ